MRRRLRLEACGGIFTERWIDLVTQTEGQTQPQIILAASVTPYLPEDHLSQSAVRSPRDTSEACPALVVVIASITNSIHPLYLYTIKNRESNPQSFGLE